MVQEFVVPRDGCPFCGEISTDVIWTGEYAATAEASGEIENFAGDARRCAGCGVVYPGHCYRASAFPVFYGKAFDDLRYFDDSPLQNLRRGYLREILRHRHADSSVSALLDAVSMRALQAPLLDRAPKSLEILDLGAGFGEFLHIFRDLGNHVVGTELHPSLARHLVDQGFECHVGELEEIDFAVRRFDVVLARAVLYRTREPRRTLELLSGLIKPDGIMTLIDPCTDEAGARYFLQKHFPQGQFYVLDRERYAAMLRREFGLEMTAHRQIYGRPDAPLKKVRLIGNLVGLGELFLGNLLRRKPYVLAYTLKRNEQCVG